MDVGTSKGLSVSGKFPIKQRQNVPLIFFFLIPNLWLHFKNKAICLGASGWELHILRVFKEPKKKKKRFKIKCRHCSLNYKLRLVKENTILTWKEKTPSPERVVNLVMQLPLFRQHCQNSHTSDQPQVLSPYWKDSCLSFFYEASAPFSYQQQRALPLPSCLSFLPALITKELHFHTGPSRSEELLPLSIITEIRGNRMSLSHKAPNGLSISLAPEQRRPAWEAPSEGHLVPLLSSGKMAFNSTKRSLTLKSSKEGPSLASCYHTHVSHLGVRWVWWKSFSPFFVFLPPHEIYPWKTDEVGHGCFGCLLFPPPPLPCVLCSLHLLGFSGS